MPYNDIHHTPPNTTKNISFSAYKNVTKNPKKMTLKAS